MKTCNHSAILSGRFQPSPPCLCLHRRSQPLSLLQAWKCFGWHAASPPLVVPPSHRQSVRSPDNGLSSLILRWLAANSSVPLGKHKVFSAREKKSFDYASLPFFHMFMFINFRFQCFFPQMLI